MFIFFLKCTFNDAPGISASANFTTVNFDDRVGTDNGEGDAIAQSPLLFPLLFVVHVGEFVDFYLVLSNLVQNLLKNVQHIIGHQ